MIRFRAELFNVRITRIVFTFKYAQTWFSDFPEVEFTKELVPSSLLNNNPIQPSLVVFDDLICDSKALQKCAAFFVRGSHHLNASVFFLTQNLFAHSPHYRTISLNTNQFVLFKSVRGRQQIQHLARQFLCGDKNKMADFMRVFMHATRQPFSYLLVDLEPAQQYRLRSRIFPDDEAELVYLLDDDEDEI